MNAIRDTLFLKYLVLGFNLIVICVMILKDQSSPCLLLGRAFSNYILHINDHPPHAL